MKINKNSGILLLGILLILSLGIVSATVTLVTPASSATVSGSTAWNATNSSFNEMVNCSIYVRSTSTANSSYVNVSTATNSSASANFINGTFNSALVEDSNDYSIYASCTNSTGTVQNSSANTGITIDNTVPQTPSSATPATGTVDTDGSVDFSATVTGANTTECTLYFSGIGPGASSYTMTHSGNTCTHTLSTMPEQTYQWYITASDGTNTSSGSTTAYLNVDVKTSAGKAAVLAQQPGIKSEGGALLSITGEGGLIDSIGGTTTLIIVIIIIVLAIIIAKRK